MAKPLKDGTISYLVYRCFWRLRAVLGLPPSTPSIKLRTKCSISEPNFVSKGSKLMSPKSKEPSSLDLGCGSSPKNPFRASVVRGVDIRESADKTILSADLALERIPFDSKSFSYVTAYDFLEHIPRVSCGAATRFPFVELMNEIHRVLEPGGIFYSHTPAYPFSEAFQDPTHVNIITEDTFANYFCSSDQATPLAAIYGFTGLFKLIDQAWDGCYLLTMMRKSF